MQNSSTFFNELTFDQLTELAGSRYTLKINPKTNSESLKTVNKQLTYFKELLEHFYFNPEGFDATPFFRVDPFLVFNFLRLSHVYYLDKKIPEIEQNIQLLRKSNDTPETRVLSLLFQDYKLHLTKHIEMEEGKVFPLIRQIIDSRHEDKLLCHSAQLRSQLVEFYIDHSDTERDLNYINELVRNLCLHERGLASILMNQLALFEADLRLHHVLEEEILVPSVLEIIY
jgi:regulator of cell morphogenesis and NO signaling